MLEQRVVDGLFAVVASDGKSMNASGPR
jgi:hypothetical protein